MSTSALFAEILRSELSGIIEISDAQIQRLFAHYELLARWNRRLNLTTVIDMPAAVYRHYCESLFVAAHISGTAIVDVGSGAGFPGIPIAIVRPEWHVTLVESHMRKAAFLREATRDLRNVNVLDCRAEEVAARYDWLVSRAVHPAGLMRLQLAPCAAILVGLGGIASVPGGRIIPVPWGDRRSLVIKNLNG